MPDGPSTWVPISSGELSAAIDPLGAQLSLLRDRDARDLLWDGDPAVWTGRAPLLFPIVGVLQGGHYRLGSSTFPLSRHGFARGRPFTLESRTPTAVVLRLVADDASLEIYPFRFALEVRFELRGSTLALTTSIRNQGDAAMPASFGYHPAFRWPLPYGEPRGGHFIEFEDEEPAPIRRIDAAGLLRPQFWPTPVANRRLALADALFTDDAVIFDRIVSRTVTYGADRGPRIRVNFADAVFLGVWSKPGARFVCIEPWNGITDPQGFSDDFTRKPGVFIIAPGAGWSSRMLITLAPP